jgi:hypothetical protein
MVGAGALSGDIGTGIGPNSSNSATHSDRHWTRSKIQIFHKPALPPWHRGQRRWNISEPFAPYSWPHDPQRMTSRTDPLKHTRQELLSSADLRTRFDDVLSPARIDCWLNPLVVTCCLLERFRKSGSACGSAHSLRPTTTRSGASASRPRRPRPSFAQFARHRINGQGAGRRVAT